MKPKEENRKIALLGSSASCQGVSRLPISSKPLKKRPLKGKDLPPSKIISCLANSAVIDVKQDKVRRSARININHNEFIKKGETNKKYVPVSKKTSGITLDTHIPFLRSRSKGRNSCRKNSTQDGLKVSSNPVNKQYSLRSKGFCSAGDPDRMLQVEKKMKSNGNNGEERMSEKKKTLESVMNKKKEAMLGDEPTFEIKTCDTIKPSEVIFTKTLREHQVNHELLTKTKDELKKHREQNMVNDEIESNKGTSNKQEFELNLENNEKKFLDSVPNKIIPFDRAIVTDLMNDLINSVTEKVENYFYSSKIIQIIEKHDPNNKDHFGFHRNLNEFYPSKLSKELSPNPTECSQKSTTRSSPRILSSRLGNSNTTSTNNSNGDISNSTLLSHNKNIECNDSIATYSCGEKSFSSSLAMTTVLNGSYPKISEIKELSRIMSQKIQEQNTIVAVQKLNDKPSNNLVENIFNNAQSFTKRSTCKQNNFLIKKPSPIKLTAKRKLPSTTNDKDSVHTATKNYSQLKTLPSKPGGNDPKPLSNIAASEIVENKEVSIPSINLHNASQSSQRHKPKPDFLFPPNISLKEYASVKFASKTVKEENVSKTQCFCRNQKNLSLCSVDEFQNKKNQNNVSFKNQSGKIKENKTSYKVGKTEKSHMHEKEILKQKKTNSTKPKKIPKKLKEKVAPVLSNSLNKDHNTVTLPKRKYRKSKAETSTVSKNGFPKDNPSVERGLGLNEPSSRCPAQHTGCYGCRNTNNHTCCQHAMSPHGATPSPRHDCRSMCSESNIPPHLTNAGRDQWGSCIQPSTLPHIEMAFPAYLYDSPTRYNEQPLIADFMDSKVCQSRHYLYSQPMSLLNYPVPYSSRGYVNVNNPIPSVTAAQSNTLAWNFNLPPPANYTNFSQSHDTRHNTSCYPTGACVQSDVYSYSRYSGNRIEHVNTPLSTQSNLLQNMLELDSVPGRLPSSYAGYAQYNSVNPQTTGNEMLPERNPVVDSTSTDCHTKCMIGFGEVSETYFPPIPSNTIHTNTGTQQPQENSNADLQMEHPVEYPVRGQSNELVKTNMPSNSPSSSVVSQQAQLVQSTEILNTDSQTKNPVGHLDKGRSNDVTESSLEMQSHIPSKIPERANEPLNFATDIHQNLAQSSNEPKDNAIVISTPREQVFKNSGITIGIDVTKIFDAGEFAKTSVFNYIENEHNYLSPNSVDIHKDLTNKDIENAKGIEMFKVNEYKASLNTNMNIVSEENNPGLNIFCKRNDQEVNKTDTFGNVEETMCEYPELFNNDIGHTDATVRKTGDIPVDKPQHILDNIVSRIEQINEGRNMITEKEMKQDEVFTKVSKIIDEIVSAIETIENNTLEKSGNMRNTLTKTDDTNVTLTESSQLMDSLLFESGYQHNELQETTENTFTSVATKDIITSSSPGKIFKDKDDIPVRKTLNMPLEKAKTFVDGILSCVKDFVRPSEGHCNMDSIHSNIVTPIDSGSDKITLQNVGLEKNNVLGTKENKIISKSFETKKRFQSSATSKMIVESNIMVANTGGTRTFNEERMILRISNYDRFQFNQNDSSTLISVEVKCSRQQEDLLNQFDSQPNSDDYSAREHRCISANNKPQIKVNPYENTSLLSQHLHTPNVKQANLQQQNHTTQVYDDLENIDLRAEELGFINLAIDEYLLEGTSPGHDLQEYDTAYQNVSNQTDDTSLSNTMNQNQEQCKYMACASNIETGMPNLLTDITNQVQASSEYTSNQVFDTPNFSDSSNQAYGTPILMTDTSDPTDCNTFDKSPFTHRHSAGKPFHYAGVPPTPSASTGYFSQGSADSLSLTDIEFQSLFPNSLSDFPDYPDDTLAAEQDLVDSLFSQVEPLDTPKATKAKSKEHLSPQSPISIKNISKKITIQAKPNEDNFIRVEQNGYQPHHLVRITKDKARSRLFDSYDRPLGLASPSAKHRTSSLYDGLSPSTSMHCNSPGTSSGVNILRSARSRSSLAHGSSTSLKTLRPRRKTSIPSGEVVLPPPALPKQSDTSPVVSKKLPPPTVRRGGKPASMTSSIAPFQTPVSQNNAGCPTTYSTTIASSSVASTVHLASAAQVIVPCVYKVYGCTVQLSTSDMPQHEFSCPYQCIKCPTVTCKWYEPLLFFNEHVLTQHLQHVENSPKALFLIKLDQDNVSQVFYQRHGSYTYVFLLRVMPSFIRGNVSFIRTPQYEYNHHYISLQIKNFGLVKTRLFCPVPMFLGEKKQFQIPDKKTKFLIKRTTHTKEPKFMEMFTEVVEPKVSVKITKAERAVADACLARYKASSTSYKRNTNTNAMKKSKPAKFSVKKTSKSNPDPSQENQLCNVKLAPLIIKNLKTKPCTQTAEIDVLSGAQRKTKGAEADKRSVSLISKVDKSGSSSRKRSKSTSSTGKGITSGKAQGKVNRCLSPVGKGAPSKTLSFSDKASKNSKHCETFQSDSNGKKFKLMYSYVPHKDPNRLENIRLKIGDALETVKSHFRSPTKHQSHEARIKLAAAIRTLQCNRKELHFAQRNSSAGVIRRNRGRPRKSISTHAPLPATSNESSMELPPTSKKSSVELSSTFNEKNEQLPSSPSNKVPITPSPTLSEATRTSLGASLPSTQTSGSNLSSVCTSSTSSNMQNLKSFRISKVKSVTLGSVCDDKRYVANNL